MNNEIIIYPTKFKPSNCPIFEHNEIFINASPEKIWFWLTKATSWPQWYSNASNIQILNKDKNHLQSASKFKWKTFGVNLTSEVEEYMPSQRLAWRAEGMGVLAYHAWLIISNENSCKVITEETQQGWVCRLGKLFMPNSLHNHNQLWLEGLKNKSENQ